MKLVFSSYGFTNKKIANEVSKLIGKSPDNINVAIISEAVYGLPKDNNKIWLIKEYNNIAKYIHGNIDFINLKYHSKKEIRERLCAADLIYLTGGDEFVYPKIFFEVDILKLFKSIAREKVIMGSSAGSMFMGKFYDSKKFLKESYNLNKNDIKYPNLELVSFNIIPHFKRKDQTLWTKEFLKSNLADNSFPVYAIKDSEAIIYNDGKVDVIGNIVIYGNSQKRKT